MRKSEISECELLVMKCIWDAGDSLTCQEIVGVLKTKYNIVYKDTTVYTFLNNLKEKGFVESYRRGVTFFKAARDEVEFRNQQLLQKEKFWFGGSTAKLVSALCDVKKLSKKEREEIKKVLDEFDD